LVEDSSKQCPAFGTIVALSDCLIPKAKAPRSFETSVTIYESTRCNTAEDLSPQQHRCGNYKSCKFFRFHSFSCPFVLFTRTVPVSLSRSDVLCPFRCFLWHVYTLPLEGIIPLFHTTHRYFVRQLNVLVKACNKNIITATGL
jgi:hypothetical protein